MWLRGCEGQEQFGSDLLRQAGAGVGDRDFHHLTRRGLDHDSQLSSRRILHGVHGVSKEVDEHLLDLNSIDENEVDL